MPWSPDLTTVARNSLPCGSPFALNSRTYTPSPLPSCPPRSVQLAVKLPLSSKSAEGLLFEPDRVLRSNSPPAACRGAGAGASAERAASRYSSAKTDSPFMSRKTSRPPAGSTLQKSGSRTLPFTTRSSEYQSTSSFVFVSYTAMLFSFARRMYNSRPSGLYWSDAGIPSSFSVPISAPRASSTTTSFPSILKSDPEANAAQKTVRKNRSRISIWRIIP